MYAIYLRKSRSDAEKEREQEYDTLKRHKSVLVKYASENRLTIIDIYEELESGESIIQRPQMLELLKAIEMKKYSGVLVMDIDRLGRGDMQDQGLILDTFKRTGTKIITPRKTYDLHDEFDEEYTEFEAFMARKELKLINRRLQRGRIKSIEEGNYLGTYPPFGYLIKKEKNKRLLVKNEEQADIVVKIFNMYVNENCGSKKIANYLNSIGSKSYTNIEWTGNAVISIIKNRVYIGNIEWRKKGYSKPKSAEKRREVATNSQDEWIVVENAHIPIVDKSLFNKANIILSGRYHPPYKTKLTNPFAGLILCKNCGKPMSYRPYKTSAPHLVCTYGCGMKSSKFEYVETRVVSMLKEMLEYNINLEIELDKKTSSKSINEVIKLKELMDKLKRELLNNEKQKDNLYDLLEQGIYDTDLFLTRNTKLSEKIDGIKLNIEQLELEIQYLSNKENKSRVILSLKNIIDAYPTLNTAKQKNELMKSLVDKIFYYKEKIWKLDHFELIINLKF